MSSDDEYFKIRKATKHDVAQIVMWLKKEHEVGIQDNFFSELELIRKRQEQGELTVILYQSPGTSTFEIAGFAVHNPTCIDILYIYYKNRRNYCGSELAKHCIQQAKDTGAPELVIQCAPRESYGFWRKLGFHKIDDYDRDWEERGKARLLFKGSKVQGIKGSKTKPNAE